MTQLEFVIDVAPVVTPTYAPETTIQERYEQWRDLNPWIIPALAALLDDWSAHGGRRTGVKAAVEWVRWHYGRQTKGDEFRVNNNFASRLARDLIVRYPHLEPVIETRELRAA